MSEGVQIAIITGVFSTVPVITGFILASRKLDRVTDDQNDKIDQTHALVKQVVESHPDGP